ncbi:hypothetical protein BKA69DRAFT_329263 [Paraphysoderma sedebokerense]|nr:hypothetical protein BKA69DRAFT_329263 [Paraphysoderma sedebokerense]
MALSKFPLSSASHITPFPRQFVPCIFDIISKLQPGSTLRIAWTKIIAWLVSNEVEKMGRSLMKGGKERINDTTENVNAGNLDKMLQGIKRWVSEVGAGNFGLGIRSALSAVQLVFFIQSAVVETLSSSLVSSFNDATFTDHLLTRFFAIPFYTCHFENVIFNILSANSQLSREALQSVDSEAVQEILLPVFESLLSQLKRSSLVPNAKSNILSCLTGFGH